LAVLECLAWFIIIKVPVNIFFWSQVRDVINCGFQEFDKYKICDSKAGHSQKVSLWMIFMDTSDIDFLSTLFILFHKNANIINY
jgi:hypothetical protein